MQEYGLDLSGREYGLDFSGPEYNLEAESCESNKPSGSTKGKELHDQLSDYQLPKTDFAP